MCSRVTVFVDGCLKPYIFSSQLSVAKRYERPGLYSLTETFLNI